MPCSHTIFQWMISKIGIIIESNLPILHNKTGMIFLYYILSDLQSTFNLWRHAILLRNITDIRDREHQVCVIEHEQTQISNTTVGETQQEFNLLLYLCTYLCHISPNSSKDHTSAFLIRSRLIFAKTTLTQQGLVRHQIDMIDGYVNNVLSKYIFRQ